MKTRWARLRLAGGLAGGLIACSMASAEQAQRLMPTVEPILQSATDVIGQPLVYPEGRATVTAVIVHLEEGVSTGWHQHEVPFFAQMLEGELTVDYGTKGRRVYVAGDALLEAVNWPHNGSNTGSGPVRILAVYMGSDTAKNSVAVPHP